jgi:hypothetical protein
VKRRKKGQPFTRRFTAGPPPADYPALLAKSGRFGKSRSLYPLVGCSAKTYFPLFPVLLGCVKWRLKKYLAIYVPEKISSCLLNCVRLNEQFEFINKI